MASYTLLYQTSLKRIRICVIEKGRRERLVWCRRDTLALGPQAQRYVRAQKTRSKNRRCFTVLHHHTRLSRLTSPSHNSGFRQKKRGQNFPGCNCPDPEHQYWPPGSPAIFAVKAPFLNPSYKNFFVLCFPFSIPEVHFDKSDFHFLPFGKSISILVPFPGTLSTLTFAPCNSAPCLTIESPSPVPPRSLEWLLSTR